MAEDVIKERGNDVTIEIKVYPGSSRKEVRFREDEKPALFVHSPPEKGKANKEAIKLLPKVTHCIDAYEVAIGSDALILVTDWDEFKRLDMRKMSSLMNSPILIDGRNLYDPEEITRAGFIYEGIGRCGISIQKSEAERIAIGTRESKQ